MRLVGLALPLAFVGAKGTKKVLPTGRQPLVWWRVKAT